MKTTLATIFSAKEAVAKIHRVEKPPRDSYKIAKWIRDSYQPVIETVENERNDLIKKYGEEKDGGVSIEANTQGMNDFVKDFAEYLATEIEIDPIPATMDELIEIISHGDDALIDGGSLLVVEGLTKA